MRPFFQFLFFLILIFFPKINKAQVTPEDAPIRVLFILDASGSMLEKWGDGTRFDAARDILSRTIDSLAKAEPRIWMGLRVYGHQSVNTSKDCQDSRLEVSFEPNNARKIKDKLYQIQPKGYTPITYSLIQAAQDFGEAGKFRNILILITDGIETCAGDPCRAAMELEKKRVSIRPFIIGMGLTDKERLTLDCAGFYLDAQDKTSFQKALQTAVKQSLSPTTFQLNLLNLSGQARETGLAYSLVDHYSGKLVKDYVHAFGPGGSPDTLPIDPAGVYDVKIHLCPPVWIRKPALTPGKHHVWHTQAPTGYVRIQTPSPFFPQNTQILISPLGSKDSRCLLDFNKTGRYVAGKYQIIALTLPPFIWPEVEIRPSDTLRLEVPAAGFLNIQNTQKGIGALFRQKNGTWEMVHNFLPLSNKETLALLPGEYQLFVRLGYPSMSALTRVHKITIQSFQTISLRL